MGSYLLQIGTHSFSLSCEKKSQWIVNPCLMLTTPNLGWSLLIQLSWSALKPVYRCPPCGLVLWQGQPNDSLGETCISRKMNELVSFDCMWHMCGCCWLKVVVVIVGLKMPGGGCVPLIPYLISRSRGEALNPKHTHMLTHSAANTHMYLHTHTPSQKHTYGYKRALCLFS